MRTIPKSRIIQYIFIMVAWKATFTHSVISSVLSAMVIATFVINILHEKWKWMMKYIQLVVVLFWQIKLLIVFNIMCCCNVPEVSFGWHLVVVGVGGCLCFSWHGHSSRTGCKIKTWQRATASSLFSCRCSLPIVSPLLSRYGLIWWVKVTLSPNLTIITSLSLPKG